MKIKLFLIFFLALLIRLSYLAVVPARSLALDDSYQWNFTALRFLEGKGFLTHTEDLDPKRPPVYPLFLSAIYRLFGPENFVSAKVAQSVLGAFTCGLIFLTADLLFGPAVALWSGIALAFYPPLIVYCEIIQSETLFTFLLVLFLYLWLLFNRHLKWTICILAGVALGLLNLCRGTTLFFPFFMLSVLIIIKGERKKLRQYAALFAVGILVVAPWSWRNYKVYDTFIPIVTGGPELFWFGTLPIDSQIQYGNSAEYRKLSVPKEPKEHEPFYKELAMKNIKESPVSYAVLTIKKFIFFWLKPIGHEIISQKSILLGNLVMVFHFLMIALLFIGLILTRSNYQVLFPVYLLIGYFAIFHTVLMPMSRFRLPVEPLFVLMVVAALHELWNKVRKSIMKDSHSGIG